METACCLTATTELISYALCGGMLTHLLSTTQFITFNQIQIDASMTKLLTPILEDAPAFQNNGRNFTSFSSRLHNRHIDVSKSRADHSLAPVHFLSYRFWLSDHK
jgi:hypothetical protein